MKTNRTDERASTMKRTFLGGILAAATLTATLAFTSAGASALGELVVIDEGPTACYEQIPYQVFQYQKTTSTPTFVTEYEYKQEDQKTQYEIDTFTRERRRTAGIWQNFSPNQDQGPFTGPPLWPADPRGTWNHENKPIPPGQQGPDAVYQNGNGNGSWFYRQAASAWSAWSAPARYLPTGSNLVWVDVVPAENWREHDNSYTDTYQRDWTEYPTGATRQVGAGTFTKEWFTSDPGAPWVATGSTRNTLPGEPIVTISYYNNDNVGPINLAAKGARNPGWTTDQDLDSSWVKLSEEGTFYENGDQIPCKQQPDPLVEETEERTCAPPGSTSATLTTTTTTTEYVLGKNYLWVLGEPSVKVTTEPVLLSEEELEACPTPPPAADPPAQFQVASNAPILPPAAVASAAPAAAFSAAAPAPTQLPATGSSSWAMALIALVTLLGGTALVRLSRRSNI